VKEVRNVVILQEEIDLALQADVEINPQGEGETRQGVSEMTLVMVKDVTRQTGVRDVTLQTGVRDVTLQTGARDVTPPVTGTVAEIEAQIQIVVIGKHLVGMMTWLIASLRFLKTCLLYKT